MKKIDWTVALVVLAATGWGAVSVESPAVAKPWEKTAAAELTAYLDRAVSDCRIGGQDGVVFHVGDTDLAKAKKLASADLKDEEWVVRSFGRDVVVNGGGTRGCLYAAYHFLEDVIGVRFWSEHEEDVPATRTLKLDAVDLHGKPFFIYRDIYRNMRPAESTSRHAIRRRLNRNGEVFVPQELGGGWKYGPPNHVHSFSLYIPWAEYGKTHPEYFALRDGVRVGGGGSQICVTNPDVKRLILEKLEANVAKGGADAKAKGVPAPTMYDVSMNDTPNICQCETCKAEVEKYGTTGLYFNFYNAIAAELAKRHPNLFLSTLAYYFTEDLPKGGVKPADNLIVRLCDTRSNQAASIYEPGNDVFLKLLKGWQPITKNLFVWDYAAIYAKTTKSFPFPSEFYYGDQYSAYAKHGVKGIFLEHEDQTCGDLWDIKYYIETKMMEDPFQDNAVLLDRALKEYFGAAAPFVKAVRVHLDRIRKDRKAFIGWTPELGEFDFIHADDIAKMLGLYDRAEAAVKDDARLVRRVRRARLGTDEIGKLVASYEKFRNGTGWKFEPDDLDIIGKTAPIRVVDDLESPSGKAVFLDVDAQREGHYKLPFLIGVRNQAELKTAYIEFFRQPAAERGYGVYTLRNVVFPRDSFVFLSRSWQVQKQTGYPQLTVGGKPYDIKVHVKCTGPMVRPGSTEKNGVYIGRMEFVPAEAK